MLCNCLTFRYGAVRQPTHAKYKNYQTIQLAIAKIDEILKNDETTITKEYVRGRENIYLHPAVKELAKLSDSSNKTLTMLLTIIEKQGNDSKYDELLEFCGFINHDK